MTKYALIGLLAVCATVLCFSLIFRERLCELNIHRGNTVVQVTEVKVYDEICPYRVARRVRHGVVFFTDIQGTVM